ncbi:dihydrolipoamide acetyltransferase family protein [Paludibacter jiangxiensis]|uniref:Dihydrolipoamide acetyltransferase component of pyruvate dehydrogenase complex n=1 Tax=Paludibacter jiangxiensis TaxID=681398 RepID=A0A161LS85_9BACT|nr:dihydrolipoamide acetyltransferase family protein [Paludibacter jiangxiensis]GAT63550.1 2-oxoglutarate dehydrogenase E2 component [Paludibacter jiangxiensis]
MTTFDIKMPKLGESITEGTIVAWSVKVGDAVKEDDILFEVTTAKVNAEIPSPVEGTVLKILFSEGDTVSVGTVVMVMQIEGESTGEQDTSSDTSSAAIETAPVETKEEKWYSPVVLRLANEANIPMDELDKIQGSGYLGRLSKKDIQRYITQKKDGVTAPAVTVAKKPEPVVEDRVQPQVVSSNEDQIVEMDAVRRIIADHMVLSKKTSPHVTTFVEVDVTKLVEWRKRNKDSFLKHEGISLTYMPAIVEAATKALIAYPQVNASVEGYRMILKKHINIGIAVALDDGNLVVPVVHDADKLSISGLAHTMDSLAANARANKLKIDDIQGGTFTITNFGTFKNIAGTPIINQPQVAILGIGYIVKKPAVLETADGDVIAIRHKMILSLSYDHRIVNGALGGKFLLHIAEYLENWDSK